jgi:hypothetical protein
MTLGQREGGGFAVVATTIADEIGVPEYVPDSKN